MGLYTNAATLNHSGMSTPVASSVCKPGTVIGCGLCRLNALPQMYVFWTVNGTIVHHRPFCAVSSLLGDDEPPPTEVHEPVSTSTILSGMGKALKGMYHFTPPKFRPYFLVGLQGSGINVVLNHGNAPFVYRSR